MKKVLLTGGAGHIGQHVVQRLLVDGVSVTVFDNLSTGRLDDMVPFENFEGFKFIPGDVRNMAELVPAMAGHDVVWHLAANGDIPRGIKDPDWDWQNNAVGTKNVLEAMRATGVNRILFSSTAAVYGDGAANLEPLSEKHGPLYPISLYAASKLAGEALISAYCHLFGFEAWIFRFSNVVGGGMNHGATWDFITKLRKNPKELEIWGDGAGSKPFFLTSDCVWGMLVAYRAERFTNCEIVNLGTRDFTTVSEVADIVISEMGLTGVEKKFTGGARGFPGDVPIVRYDISKAESLGWHPSATSSQAVRIAARKLLSGTL